MTDLTDAEKDAINQACIRDAERFSGTHPERGHVNRAVESILAARQGGNSDD